ncbi:21073_t:CDS:1, partial [Gigaspora rosea]
SIGFFISVSFCKFLSKAMLKQLDLKLQHLLFVNISAWSFKPMLL